MRDSPHGIFRSCTQYPRGLTSGQSCWDAVAVAAVAAAVAAIFGSCAVAVVQLVADEPADEARAEAGRRRMGLFQYLFIVSLLLALFIVIAIRPESAIQG